MVKSTRKEREDVQRIQHKLHPVFITSSIQQTKTCRSISQIPQDPVSFSRVSISATLSDDGQTVCQIFQVIIQRGMIALEPANLLHNIVQWLSFHQKNFQFELSALP